MSLSEHIQIAFGSSFTIFPDAADELAVKPYVVSKIDDYETYPTSGGYASEKKVFMTFTVYAETKSSAETTAKLLRDALVAYSGAQSSTTIQRIFASEGQTNVEYEEGNEKVFTQEVKAELIFENN